MGGEESSACQRFLSLALSDDGGAHLERALEWLSGDGRCAPLEFEVFCDNGGSSSSSSKKQSRRASVTSRMGLSRYILNAVRLCYSNHAAASGAQTCRSAEEWPKLPTRAKKKEKRRIRPSLEQPPSSSSTVVALGSLSSAEQGDGPGATDDMLKEAQRLSRSAKAGKAADGKASHIRKLFEGRSAAAKGGSSFGGASTRSGSGQGEGRRS